MKLPPPLRPGHAPHLGDDEAARPEGLPRGSELKAEVEELRGKLDHLATTLWAEQKQSLLVVLQARDAGGKDGVVKKVFGALNPRLLRVASFGAPTADERAHDFLWRIHPHVPPRGAVGVFNRSHYEDVLAVRVRGLAPREVWEGRYEQINAFEEILAANGVTLLKVFLHISREEQRRRLLKRLDHPHKRWKFDPGDLDDRDRWDEYTAAYRDVFRRCGTERAPWHVVPADDKPARDLLVARLAAAALERMAPRFPEPDFDLEALRARLERDS